LARRAAAATAQWLICSLVRTRTDNQPVVRFQVFEKQPVAIQQKKYACGRDRRPLVSVQKRMILRQALELAAASSMASA